MRVRVLLAPRLLLLTLTLALACLAPVCPAPAPALTRGPSTSSVRPRGLLLLRAACPLQNGPAFDSDSLQAAAVATGRETLLIGYHLLSYEETCGASWSEKVVQKALEAVGAGGVVVSAGWAGAGVCAVLSGARRPLPAACAAPPARAALVVELARRLRWRRVLLAGGPRGGGEECGASLRAVRAALLLAGVSVRRAPLTKLQIAQRPHVVVACISQAKLLTPESVHTPTLLLHTSAAENISSLNNITLRDERHYFHNLDSLELSSDDSSNSTNTSFVNSKHTYDKNINLVTIIERGYRKLMEEDTRHYSSPILLLSDVKIEHLLTKKIPNELHQQLLDAIEKDTLETKTNEHYLYVKVNKVMEKWQAVAMFSTVAKYDYDEEDWTIKIETLNSTDTWEGLQAIEEVEIEGKDTDAVVWGAVGAAGVAVLVLAAGAGLRAAAGRRRGRRRRGDVVLSVTDFTFPADEPRRVPDGMETMLSCWLQQLHEFGGPELDRPRAPPAPPTAPDLLLPAPASAPSSTASASRLALDRRTRYKGDAVQLKQLPLAMGVASIELRRKSTDVLLMLHTLRHENLNPFIGCLCESRPALVWDHCGRGSLEDVLQADDIKLDWTFRLSLLTDLVRGLRHLHAGPLRVHGRLSSRNCVVDSRWVLRLTDYGQPEFFRAQGLTPPPRRARDLLWTAPELLRVGGAGETAGAGGTQPGDVFSFAIIMQEVIVRGEPYCMLALSPEEIVEKLMRPPPLIRPSVSMGAAPPEAVSVMRQCWAELPDMRPDTDQLHDIFRLLHRGRKINIVDSMFEMLEKYSNNLEELIKERTEQLDMEKKKTEQLLNRMLPRTVAERLVVGMRVEPEEFEEVSIYFSDIVGFTGLAARSSPVQVVALLNDLYTTFDAAIERYRVYKVETIGDAYMVVGGLPVRARDHAESVATMALHLLHLAGRFRIRHLPAHPLHLRIGLHSGPCCAGVVGLTMPRYCLFGDTVNTASRMESTGAAWRIQVSAATAARLEAAGGYRLRSRGLTQIKGKGAMHTYWLLGKDGFDKPLPTPPPLPAEEALVEHEAEGEGDRDPADGAVLSPGARSEAADLPLVPPDKYAWTRSGAVSADSSPPAAPYSRYRCLGSGGVRVLRRQWSLERGEALGGARAGDGEGEVAGAGGELFPLSAPAPPAPPPPRYRTRPDPAAAQHHIPTSTSFD